MFCYKLVYFTITEEYIVSAGNYIGIRNKQELLIRNLGWVRSFLVTILTPMQTCFHYENTPMQYTMYIKFCSVHVAKFENFIGKNEF